MREIDEEGPAALVRREPPCNLRREPRLPDPARPGQRQQTRPSGLQNVGGLGQLALAPEQRCRRGGQVDPARGAAPPPPALLLDPDRPLERLPRPPRLD